MAAKKKCTCAAGDIIWIVLDLINKTISSINKRKHESLLEDLGFIGSNADGNTLKILHDEEEEQVLFENISTGKDIKYKIGVSMIRPKTKITLVKISYSC